MEMDWSELLFDLLIEIAKCFIFYEDIISFSNVCKSWQSAAAAAAAISDRIPSRYPSLMLPENDDAAEDDFNRQLFLLSNGGMVRNVKLPEASDMLCVSSQGWLLTMEKNEIHARLLHPLTRRQIDLPRLDTFPDHDYEVKNNAHFFIKKVVLSSNPSFTSNFFVMVLWGSIDKLGFCRPGDFSWTAATYGHHMGAIFDIAYHNNKAYVMDSTHIFVCDIHSHGSEIATLFRVSSIPRKLRPRPVPAEAWFYMLGLSTNDDNKLLIVTREGYSPRDEAWVEEDDMDYETKRFRVLEFNLKNGKWSRLKSLGNRSIFLGKNSTFFSEASGDGTIKANCIYFTDDLLDIYLYTAKGGGKHMGIYHLSDGTIEPHYRYESRCFVNPPLWVQPSL